MARDLACAALGWALALAFWIGASGLQRSLLSDAFGADGLPKGLAILLAAVSTLIALRTGVSFFLRNRAPSPVSEKEADPGFRGHAKAFGVVAIGFAYVLLAPWSGYGVAVGLVIFATALHYGARPTASLALMSAGGAVFFWLLFARLLSVSLPAGPWSRFFG